MQSRIAPWSKMPFLRILLPFIAGILLEYYIQPPGVLWHCGLILSILFIVSYFFLSVQHRFRLRTAPGYFINLLILFLGGTITKQNRLTGELLEEKQAIAYVAIVNEPPAEKPNSIKLTATIHSLHGSATHREKAIIYLKKSLTAKAMEYGSVIIFRKKLSEVRSSGNPGSFDYKRYCSFNGISYQIYLADDEYITARDKKKNWFRAFIFNSTRTIVSIIKKYIPGPKEQGLAEALLIGYKNDLDKDLVQAYSNTGVVHVIAISGLHLGLIYAILVILTRPLQKHARTKLSRCVIIISGLWIFSIMAGAQPSILRSAIMFTCIALGDAMSRRTSIYNSIALSAFIVLCYNPFWLWDAGFQLSYSAVISIIAFYKPLYNCFYFKNRIIDLAWQLSAVTFSAQLLTFPICIYHFHQFPLLFYFTNMVAVPVSSLVLIGELLLCAISFLEMPSRILGEIIQAIIRWMNEYVERFNGLHFSTAGYLSINEVQVIFLYITIFGMAGWLLEKSKKHLFTGIVSLFFVMAIRTCSFYQANNQGLLVVYNIQGSTAVEYINGRKVVFLGDSNVVRNKTVYNFNIYPAHVRWRLQKHRKITSLQSFTVMGKTISVIDGKRETVSGADVVIFSGKTIPATLTFPGNEKIPFVIIDSSVPAWKSARIKKQLDERKIIHHDVSEKGAFLMKL